MTFTASSGLTLPASRQLEQLAKDALEEEQYDMVVDCLDQIVTLGFHPPPEFIRALFAIVLSAPSDVGSSASTSAYGCNSDGSSALDVLRRAEPTGPNAATIADAATLLEKIAAVSGSDVVLSALPPDCAGADAAEQAVGAASAASSRRSSLSPSASRRRTSGVRRAESREADSDDDSSRSRSDSPSNQFSKRLRQMAQSSSVWDVLAFDPSAAEPTRKPRRVNHREGDDDEDGVGKVTDHTRIEASLHHDAVWRALALLVRFWRQQRLQVLQQGTSKLHLISQLIEPSIQSSVRISKRGKREQSPGPCEELSKALVAVRSGLMSCSSIFEKMRGVTSKEMQRIRHKRSQTAANLLAEIFFLAETSAIRYQPVVRGLSDMLFTKFDEVAISVSVKTVRAQLCRPWTLYLSMLLCLSRLGLEESVDDSGAAARYEKAMAAVMADSDASEHLKKLVQELNDEEWVLGRPDFEHFDADQIARDCAPAIRTKAFYYLNSNDWLVAREQGRGKRTRTSLASRAKGLAAATADDIHAELHALAVATRVRAREIDLVCSRVVLKAELIDTLLNDDASTATPAPRSVCNMAALCTTMLLTQVTADEADIERCIEAMQSDVEAAADRLEQEEASSQLKRASMGRHRHRGTYGPDDGDDDKSADLYVEAADHLRACTKALDSCRVSLHSLRGHHCVLDLLLSSLKQAQPASSPAKKWREATAAETAGSESSRRPKRVHTRLST